MKKIVVVLALLVAIISFSACEKDEDKRNDNQKMENQVFKNIEVKSIRACYCNNLEENMERKLAIRGDYSILMDFEPQNIESFVSLFDGYVINDNFIKGRLPENFNAGDYVIYVINDDILMACSLDKIPTQSGDMYTGIVDNKYCIMTDECAEYTKRIYDACIEEASLASEQENVIYLPIDNRLIDFNAFDENYDYLEAKSERHTVVNYTEKADSGMSFEAFQQFIKSNPKANDINNRAYYSFYNLCNLYGQPNELLEHYIDENMWFYFSDKKLIGVVFYEVKYSLEGYKTLGEYIEFAFGRYISEHPDEKDVDPYSDEVCYDMPTLEQEIILYYWNLNELQTIKYKNVGCNYVEDGISAFFLTNDDMTEEKYWHYTPSLDGDFAIIGNGKVVSLAMY